MTPASDFIDSGWQISQGVATHFPCNPGYIIKADIQGLVVGNTYPINVKVSNYNSGSVNAILGTTNGPSHSAAGNFSDNMLCAGNTTLKFYSNGWLSISDVVIEDPYNESQPITVAFSEKHKLWVNQQNLPAEMMARFGDELFTFNNGSMWHQDANPVRNNFFGAQYPSEIIYYVNTDPASIKIFHNMIIESNSKWEVISATIKPYPGKNLGMLSRIKVDKFVELQGIYYADFLRNMLDPRFNTEIEALLRGEELRGRVLEVRIRNSSTDEATLFAVDTKYSKQALTP